MKKINVNVIMGGPSAEHEVSLNSGIEVIKHINRERYNVRAVLISRAKAFYFADTNQEQLPTLSDCENPQASQLMQGPFPPDESGTIWKNCDVAFLALHGGFGEDGIIQGYLETLGIPFTGSGTYASAVAMNKITSKYLYLQYGLSSPPFSIYGRTFPENSIDRVASRHGFPCFVKCPQSGSSKLMGRASSKKELADLLVEFSRFSPEILVEESVSGIEFTCGVIEDDQGMPTALPPVEIRPAAATFFDYNAKYTTGASEEIVPAPHPSALLLRIQQVALDAHAILSCSGISRTDMIYHKDTLFVLETNTLPGLTANSLFPKSFKAMGGSFTELIDRLITGAVRKTNLELQ